MRKKNLKEKEEKKIKNKIVSVVIVVIGIYYSLTYYNFNE